jgi:hypothetical protein
MSAIHFFLNEVDAARHKEIMSQAKMIQKMNDRDGKFRWSFMHDEASLHTAADTV